MTVVERNDIYYIHVNDVDLRVGKSNHIILNPEVIIDMYGVSISDKNITIEELKDLGNRSNIRAFKSFVQNLVTAIELKENEIKYPTIEEPKVVTITLTIVERDNNLAIYAKIASSLKMISILFIIVVIICIIMIVKLKPHISLK